MIYIDNILGYVKNHREVEQEHSELVKRIVSQERFEDIIDLTEYIKEYYIVLDDEEQESINTIRINNLEPKYTFSFERRDGQNLRIHIDNILLLKR